MIGSAASRLYKQAVGMTVMLEAILVGNETVVACESKMKKLQQNLKQKWVVLF